MSALAMTAEQRAELATEQRQSRNMRHWKCSQAVLLRTDGMPLAVVAANRCAPNLDELAQQAMAWLAALSPYDRLRCSGLLSLKVQWLST